MNNTDLNGIALITGASRGLGAALAITLAKTHHIVAVARTTGGLEEIDDAINSKGGRATLAPMDIGNADAVAHLCRSISDRWGKVDIWLHTAIHASPLTPANHLDIGDWQKSVDINATATARLITFIAPLLGEAGTALFFDDTVSGGKFYSAYGATKAAQIALAKSWRAETAKIGPKVHIHNPKPMPTATRARFHPGEDRDSLESTEAEAIRALSKYDLLSRH
ncbi:MAG: SDR family NAD(P)-dependent oxidoreductase [Roseovarius sp.]|nr:SDR family NAD(P)-dependent oxidoreductase [Roseovarius sp.]